MKSFYSNVEKGFVGSAALAGAIAIASAGSLMENEKGGLPEKEAVCVANDSVGKFSARKPAVLIHKNGATITYEQKDSAVIEAIQEEIAGTQASITLNATPVLGQIFNVGVANNYYPNVIKFTANLSDEEVVPAKDKTGAYECSRVSFNIDTNVVDEHGGQHEAESLLEKSVVAATDKKGMYAGLLAFAFSMVGLLRSRGKKAKKI